MDLMERNYAHVVQTYKVIFREAGTNGKCAVCGADELSMRVEATSYKEAIKIARRAIVIQAVDCETGSYY